MFYSTAALPLRAHSQTPPPPPRPTANIVRTYCYAVNRQRRSFAVRTLKLLVQCLTVLLLVHLEQIWRTKCTSESRKRHPPGHHSVRMQITGLGAFALPRPAD